MIYKLDRKQMRDYMKKFHDTEYGKIMFIICYSSFFVLFLLLILNFIFKIFSIENHILLIILCLFSFLIGSYFFYRELRLFINNEKK